MRADVAERATGRHADAELFELEDFDERLRAEVAYALRSSGHLPLRNIRASTVHGRVCLLGRVPTYYLKQVAQSVAMGVDGVHALQNELIVQ